MKNSFDEWVSLNSMTKLIFRILIICSGLYLVYLIFDMVSYGFYMERGIEIICFTLVTWLLCYISANLKNL